jgi:hypothetical protein
MNSYYTQIILTLVASAISGIAATLFSNKKSKRERASIQADRAHDQLLIEIKDLQIKLYKLEKDLTEWKEKYFQAIQELIKVKAELEGTMLKLTHIQMHSNED